MNISNKEDAVLLLLNQLDSRHERVIRIYFELGNEKKKSIEAIINCAGIASMNLALTTDELTVRKIINTIPQRIWAINSS